VRPENHNLIVVREALWKRARRYPLLAGLVYRSAYDFVADHGVEYPRIAWRHEFPTGVVRQCFGNAVTLAARDGLRYVEGFALCPDHLAHLHAWNVTPAGDLVDSTWLNSGLFYIGVEFSVERADDATWNGDACILNDDKRNYPVFQRRWEGEDFELSWPASDRLDALRTGSSTLPPSIVKWIQTLEPKG
jgi:hypothetical protein